MNNEYPQPIQEGRTQFLRTSTFGQKFIANEIIDLDENYMCCTIF